MCPEVEAQADAVADRSARCDARCDHGTRERLARGDGDQQRESRAQARLGNDDVRRIEVRQRTGDRVVCRPRQCCPRDSQSAPYRTARRTSRSRDQQSARREHQHDCDSDATSDVLAVQEASEDDGEDRLRVQHQRRDSPLGSLKSPREARGGNDCAEEGDEDKPPTVTDTKGRLPAGPAKRNEGGKRRSTI